MPPAVQYNSTNIRTAPELATKPNFSAFQVSLVDIKRAAQNGKGIYLSNFERLDDARLGVAGHLQLERHGHLQVLQEDLQPGPVDPAVV